MKKGEQDTWCFVGFKQADALFFAFSCFELS
jgi:hypothetical protein